MISEKNGKKMNLREHFLELLDGLLNRIWSVQRFGSVSWFNGISTIMGYSMQKQLL